MENDDLISSPGLIPRLKQFQFNLTQRILFSWIRPTILGCDPDYLGIAPEDLVCYVMSYRSTADLLVVDRACRQQSLHRPLAPISELEESRSFFFLGHPEGWFGRKTLREQSARMQRLLTHQNSLDKSIKIVPVSLFWGHQPDREKSFFKLLLSENWAATSRFKRLMAALIHPNHILVQFSQPIDLKEIVDSEAEPGLQARKLHRLLRTQFTNQKQAIIGPDLSHRRTLINAILESSAVQAEVQVKDDPKATQKQQKQAIAYANEIASDQSYRVIRFFHVLLTWLWNKLYDGIEVNNVEVAKSLARSHEVVYIPCHRSHIDYLLLSYVLYHNGLTPPHIAAGKNLNLPIVGPLLRRGGAFFMRRSFKGDALYRAVFDEYLHQMFSRGYSVEYFIEGGRSRTGRTLTPRAGMLNMTVNSFRRDASKPIAFLPVYFGYERIIEAATYMGELAGQAKKDESLFDIFGVFKSLTKPFGRVSVNFGKPLELAPFLDEHLQDWRAEEVDPLAYTNACSILASTLARRINSAVAVTSTNLLATAILSTPRQTITRRRLASQITLLQAIARDAPLSDELSITSDSVDEIIEHGTSVAQLGKMNQGFDEIFYAQRSTAILLTYYKNNTLHVFALASLIARIVRCSERIHANELAERCLILQPYLEAETMLFWGDTLSTAIDKTLKLLVSLGIILETEQGLHTPSPTTDEYASLTDLAEIIEPTLERFYIVTALIEANRHLTDTDLETIASKIAHQLSTLYGLNAPEFFEQPLFNRFLSQLKTQNCIEWSSIDDTTAEMTLNPEKFDKIATLLPELLDNDVTYNALQAIHAAAKTHQIDSPSHSD